MTVILSEFIDSRSTCTTQRDDTPCMAEPDTHAPIVETNTRAPTVKARIDVPVAEVAEVNNVLELAPRFATVPFL